MKSKNGRAHRCNIFLYVWLCVNALCASRVEDWLSSVGLVFTDVPTFTHCSSEYFIYLCTLLDFFWYWFLFFSQFLNFFFIGCSCVSYIVTRIFEVILNACNCKAWLVKLLGKSLALWSSEALLYEIYMCRRQTRTDYSTRSDLLNDYFYCNFS